MTGEGSIIKTIIKSYIMSRVEEKRKETIHASLCWKRSGKSLKTRKGSRRK
jgi:hypothetical protein